jgi:hypothetical protein
VVDVVGRLAVALERVLFLLGGRRGVEVCYGDATFDRSGRVPWRMTVTVNAIEARNEE